MKFIRAHTLSIFRGDFTSFPFAVKMMLREYPNLQDTVDDPLDICRSLNAMDYWVNALLPHIEQHGMTEQDGREWIRLARTRIIGPY